MATLLQAVEQHHASVNTVMHALYDYYFLGVSKQELARLYKKHVNTIDNWVRRNEAEGTYQRKATKTTNKFTEVQKLWVIDCFDKQPLAFLDEAKAAFQLTYHITISVPTIWQILHDSGYTRIVLERRAIHIKFKDIVRFTSEMSTLAWNQLNIQFSDEASFDNRGVLRTRGYCLKGRKLAFRGEFNRKARVSVLCWINVDGVVEIFHTEGYMLIQNDRLKRVQGQVLFGLWMYLRSIEIVPLFLPAYCPFFNPIEYLFGLVKKSMQRHYVENSREPLELFVLRTLMEFEGFDMRTIFDHCGYGRDGVFNPAFALNSRTVRIGPNDMQDVQKLLEFTGRDVDDEDDGDE
ncbi:hypothetical protein AeMF1_004737 [Aphanomyces euteiches]|nr:hypothetical protein AeMF1_004737 [Aphanomyces euteiches]